MQDDTILHVKNLQVSFDTEGGTIQAVDGVNFELKKGQTLGIVGESGSGKSVTSLSVMRLIPRPPGRISGGEILFNSPTRGVIDLVQTSTPEMRHIRGNEISMIFQEPMTSLNPVFTCGAQVMEAIMLHQKIDQESAKKLTLDLFEQVQLPRPEDIFYSYPHQISGGQKQRVMIAMAMSCKPSVLIADEPTTALDVTVQKTILQLMDKLRRETNMAIVFITHDLGVIAEIADYVLVMYKGKVVEQGTVLEIFENPKHPYTKGLLACRPRVDIRLKVLPTVTSFMEEDENGELIEIEKSFEEVMNAAVQTRQEYLMRQVELADSKPLLEVKFLKKYFPVSRGLFGNVKKWVRAVDQITFNVFEGECLGLVGESGCGKTTLGRTLIRLLDPDGGEIRYDGLDITKLNEREMRNIRKDLQIIFQDPYSSLNPRITIGNAILEPMQVHKMYSSEKERKEKVYELLERVGLERSHYNRYPHEFSGGQRQRVCIARALSVRPRLVICDESVSALDVSVQAQVLNLLNELRREYNLTYIFISHDLSVVKFMADRMMVMNQGLVEEMGYSESVYNNPQEEYTKKLIASIPRGELGDIRAALEARGSAVN
ncbi:MAG: ABC transporter ATP-binding protein [Bacteroidia bacterium]|nr:ABC transporter ATP-binding protein [Bacteroidia bacterium]